MMEIAMSNPRVSMGGPQQSMGFGQLPLPASSPQVSDMPAPMAAPAGPAPLPPQRPAVMPQPSAPMPPVRPEGVGFNDPNRLVQGYNPYATGAGPNAQAFADQFAGGDLSKLAARTYRDEDGNSWNDYYVR